MRWMMVLLLSLSLPAQAINKPNIVLVFMDNLGYGEVGVYGGGELRGAPTPRIDNLAGEGTQLLNFNVESQCAPSRAALLTGRLAIRTGNKTVPRYTPVYGLVQWEYTLAEMLLDAGYATGIFGKWHLGNTPGRYPTDAGFDEWFGVPTSGDTSYWEESEYFDPDSHPMAAVPWAMQSTRGELPNRIREFGANERGLIDRELTIRAIDFFKHQAETTEPFFAYIPYTLVHSPIDVHPDFRGKSGHGIVADGLMEMDHNIGLLLDALAELGIAEETMFIFTSDNGPEPPLRGLSHGSSGPWRGTMFTPLEGSLRVPFVARWPNKIPAGRVSNEIVHLTDVYTTIASLVGGSVPDDRAIDGVDQLDFLLGRQENSNREGFVVYVGGDVMAIKWRDWKMHFRTFEKGDFWGPVHRYPIPHLYNLVMDPKEEHNVMLQYSWTRWPIFEILNQHEASLERYPPIEPGTPDPYTP